jgi:hypothetical protein
MPLIKMLLMLLLLLIEDDSQNQMRLLDGHCLGAAGAGADGGVDNLSD